MDAIILVQDDCPHSHTRTREQICASLRGARRSPKLWTAHFPLVAPAASKFGLTSMLISTTILSRIRVRLWVNWGASHDDRAALDETVPHKDPRRLLILDREAGGQGLAEGSIVTERAGCCQSRSPHQMADNGMKQNTVLVACPVGTHGLLLSKPVSKSRLSLATAGISCYSWYSGDKPFHA